MVKEATTTRDTVKDANFTLRMSGDLKARLQAIADADDRSLAYVVNKALVAYVESREASKRR